MTHFWRPGQRLSTFGDRLARNDPVLDTFCVNNFHCWSLWYNLLLTPYINKIHDTPGTCSNAYLLLGLSIHWFVPHLINQDHINLCVKISQTSTWICANFPPLCSTLTQDLNCTSMGWYYSLVGSEWKQSCHNATKRKYWTTECCTYDSSIMLHVLQTHWGKTRGWGVG